MPTPAGGGYLPSLATHWAWFPVHRGTIEKFGRFNQRATAWTRPGNSVGNGAFVLQEWTTNKVIRVTKSPTYWDRDRVQLNEVAFFPIETVAEEVAFRAGQPPWPPSSPIKPSARYQRDWPPV